MSNHRDIVIVGGGIAGLTVGCLLAGEDKSITLLEQNWLPGGCASSYPRKHYIFESGATTLVGLDEGMPLQFLLQKTGIKFPHIELDIPMRVYLKNGAILTRYKDLNDWISEAERVFGKKNQRAFWEYCYRISRFVWETSIQQRAFPPSNFSDLVFAARHFQPRQLQFATLAFQSMQQLLAKYDLLDNSLFVDFVNEQLLITAQNYVQEVNVLFGATALCYTNFGNYYVPGGLLNLVQPMVDYIRQKGSEVNLRENVIKIRKEGRYYQVETNKDTYTAAYVISSLPINNTLELYDDEQVKRKYSSRLLQSQDLNSAFSLGLVFKKRKDFDCIHNQIHLRAPLPYSGSTSIFLSMSMPGDTLRCAEDEIVGSVSTHVHHPERTMIEDKELVSQAIVDELEHRGFLQREDIVFSHASTPKAWKKWTGRSWGFVGGYPQYMRIKPWQMLDARLDHEGLYICGDSTYPGQGIPGACLSGIAAWQKMKLDKV